VLRSIVDVIEARAAVVPAMWPRASPY
jgi:hypothetical protein